MLGRGPCGHRGGTRRGDSARRGRVRSSGRQALHRQTDPAQPRGVHGAPSVTSKVVGSIADDVEGRGLYLGYAREDRSALWLRIPDEADVPKALRMLADHDYLHTRYYRSEQQTD